MSRRPRRRRSETPSMVATLTRGIAAFAIVGAFIWLGVIAFDGVPFRGYKYISVSAPQLGNLLSHDEVRIAGVLVGQVQSIGLDSDDRPVVRLQIDPGTKLPIGTRFLIRANGLLGARYIQLIPGSGQTELPANATLYGGPEAITFGIPDALDTFDRKTRGGLASMTNGLGAGFLGRGDQLNQALQLAPTGVADDEQLIGAVLSRPGAARRLIPSLGSAATPLAANRANLSVLPGVTADAIQPFVDKRNAVRNTLDVAPGALSSATAGLAAGDRLLAATSGLARQLARTLPFAPAGLRAASTLLATSHLPLRRATTLLGAVGPAVPAALRITGSVPPLLGPLDKAVTRLTPMLEYINSYGCNIINWGSVMRSMDDFGGNGTGPVGWVGEFRAQATVLSPGQTIGINGGTALLSRDGYSPPCKYLASPYPLDTH